MKKTLKLNTLMILACAVLFALSMFAIEPLLVLVTNDITLSVTPLPYLFDILRNLCDIGAFAICYALIIFGALKHSPKMAWGLFGIYCACCAIRRGAVLLISFASIDELGIVNTLLALLLEALIAAIVTIIAVHDGSVLRDLEDKTRKAARALGDFSEPEPISFGSVFSRENPYLVCALKATVIMAIVTVGRRIISDIFYGAPESLAEVLVMAVYYLFDILMCAIFYALTWLVLSKLNAHQDSSL